MSDVYAILSAIADRIALAYDEIEGEHDRPVVEVLRSADHAETILADPPSTLICYAGQRFQPNQPHSAARQPPTLTVDIWFSGRDPKDIGPREIDIYTMTEAVTNSLLSFCPVKDLVGRMVIVDEETSGILPSAIWIRQSWTVRISTQLRGQE